MIEYALLAACIVGASYTSYRLGVRQGSEKTIDKLHSMKVIAFDQKGFIKPNPFYKEN